MTTTRQQIQIATNALLDRIEAEGCHFGTISIDTGLMMGKGRTRVRATVHTTRRNDTDRYPADVVITSACDSDTTVADVEVLAGR